MEMSESTADRIFRDPPEVFESEVKIGGLASAEVEDKIGGAHEAGGCDRRWKSRTCRTRQQSGPKTCWR